MCFRRRFAYQSGQTRCMGPAVRGCMGVVWGWRVGRIPALAFDSASKSSSKKATQVIRKWNFSRKTRDDNIRKRKSESRTRFSPRRALGCRFPPPHDWWRQRVRSQSRSRLIFFVFLFLFRSVLRAYRTFHDACVSEIVFEAFVIEDGNVFN